MIGIRVQKKNAEATRAYLKAHKLMDKQHDVFSRNAFIYFPISHVDVKDEAGLRKLSARRINAVFKGSNVHGDYRGSLLKRLGKERYENATKSYDLIGDTAIISATRKEAGAMAKVIVGINKNVKRVVNKNGAVRGVYRIRDFSHVWGRRGYEVVYRENGISLVLDIRKAFFSPRLAYERKRISDSARDGENVVVMFGGIGPFSILIAKMHKNSKVVSIELNREAHKYLLRNISINKVVNITPVLGDVNEFGAKYKGFADRIIMPLPKDSYNFLETANKMARKGCMIHYYAFGEAKDPYYEHIRKINALFNKSGRSVRIISKRIVRSYSATEDEAVIDFAVS